MNLAPLYPLLSRLVIFPLHRLRRSMTLGVRVAAFDAEGRVMLVRHSYSPGWIFPGGGVERGETIWEAAARELAEESGLSVTARPELFGFYCNEALMRGDHLALLVARAFTAGDFLPTAEISAARFFAPDEIPANTTPGTLRRLAEITGKLQPAPHW